MDPVNASAALNTIQRVARVLGERVSLKLVDAANKRNINADHKLKVTFAGKGQVSVFGMTKLVSAHLS